VHTFPHPPANGEGVARHSRAELPGASGCFPLSRRPQVATVRGGAGGKGLLLPICIRGILATLRGA